MSFQARLMIGSVFALSLGSTAFSQAILEGGRKLQTTMTGAEEVPPGDQDGSGTATFVVNPGQRRICYTIQVSNIEAPTAAHIHVGAAGTAPAGNIVVPLVNPADGDVEACADVTRELALAILKNPSNYYINVHNVPHPPGAVRGQLAK